MSQEGCVTRGVCQKRGVSQARECMKGNNYIYVLDKTALQKQKKNLNFFFFFKVQSVCTSNRLVGVK